jgi:hypothetical protein
VKFSTSTIGTAKIGCVKSEKRSVAAMEKLMTVRSGLLAGFVLLGILSPQLAGAAGIEAK